MDGPDDHEVGHVQGKLFVTEHDLLANPDADDEPDPFSLR
jgi:hypothetical protein